MGPPSCRRARWCAGALLAALLSLVCSASAAAALTVNTTADGTSAGDGTCSLREAIAAAASRNGGDCGTVTGSVVQITLPAGHYTLTLGELQVPSNASLAIAGASLGQPSPTIIGAGSHSRVLEVMAQGDASLSGVEITGGRTANGANATTAGTFPKAGDYGGGILNHGALTRAHALVTANATGHGGRGADGTPTNPSTHNGTPGDYGGFGGGIDNDTGAQLTVQASTISDNATGSGGDGGNGAIGVDANGQIAQGGGAGYGGYGGNGGGIYNAGTATITTTTISGNFTGRGGNGGAGGSGASGGAPGGDGGAGGSGGFNGSNFQVDQQGGGGIFSTGALDLSDSTVTGNGTGAGGLGGSAGNGTEGSNGRFADGGTGGQGGSGGLGGGLLLYGGTAMLTNVTIQGNRTGDGASGGGGPQGGAGAGGHGGYGGYGGGLWLSPIPGNDSFSATLRYVTVAQNGLGGAGLGGSADSSGTPGQPGTRGLGAGLADYANNRAPVAESNSIVAGNGNAQLGDTNCSIPGSGAMSDGGHNVSADSSCPGTVGDAALGPLQDNGGPTQTMLPGTGSIAIDIVPAASCPSTDQRLYPRPDAGESTCDAGAVETGSSSPNAQSTSTSLASSANPSNAGDAVTFTATVSPAPDGGTVAFADGSSEIPGCGAEAVNGAGAATCTVTYPSGGTHSITATYSGDQGFAGSTSPVLSQLVLRSSGGGGGTSGGGGGTSGGAGGTSGGGVGGNNTGNSGNGASGQGAAGRLTIQGQTVLVVLTCHGSTSTDCAFRLLLSALERLRGHHLIAIGAKRKPKPTTRRVTLGTATATLAGDTTRTVRVRLNGAGRRLLASRHRLGVTLLVSQTSGGRVTTVLRRTVRFATPKPRRRHHH